MAPSIKQLCNFPNNPITLHPRPNGTMSSDQFASGVVLKRDPEPTRSLVVELVLPPNAGLTFANGQLQTRRQFPGNRPDGACLEVPWRLRSPQAIQFRKFAMHLFAYYSGDQLDNDVRSKIIHIREA